MAQRLSERARGPVEATGLYRAVLLRSASMYSEIQRERADIGGLMARPEYREWNPELIKPKKLLNPVKASRSHQELHRELLMNHRRGLGVDSKPELQRVLEHRRRNQLMKKKKEELEAKRLQCPFEQELLRRQQRLTQLEKQPEKEEDHAPEFIKVRENLRRIAKLTSEERVLAAQSLDQKAEEAGEKQSPTTRLRYGGLTPRGRGQEAGPPGRDETEAHSLLGKSTDLRNL
ncbi:PREDICTED: protein FAM107A [Chrysochloris asiatica]|uniref:Actin-associated protein FAM107A n=1 Tax=Chrysochloris asiatica TaxID=185453 RepID=A0A9B0WLM9_CHRAS|nr:PREDICTED: protein FAM107A [Chrysochloris asiatica]